LLVPPEVRQEEHRQEQSVRRREWLEQLQQEQQRQAGF
jgi:hypothetical protein